MRSLTQRERSGIAVLLLVACIALFEVLVVSPIIDGFSKRAEMRARLEQQYRANQRLVGMIPSLRREAERQAPQMQLYALSAPNAAIGSTLLQERLQKTVETVGGELRSTEEVSGNDGTIRARASARVTLAQLTKLLTRLQDEPPYLLIPVLAINADQSLITRKLEQVDVSLEVSVPLARAATR